MVNTGIANVMTTIKTVIQTGNPVIPEAEGKSKHAWRSHILYFKGILIK